MFMGRATSLGKHSENVPPAFLRPKSEIQRHGRGSSGGRIKISADGRSASNASQVIDHEAAGIVASLIGGPLFVAVVRRFRLTKL